MTLQGQIIVKDYCWLRSAAFVCFCQAAVCFGEDNPRVPDVVGQFSKLKHHGEALGFYIGVTSDPSQERHYQGIVRKNGVGTPYLFLSHNGNPLGAGTDFPGDIAVVQMPSRGTDGERLRSNRFSPGSIVEDTWPPAFDKGVALVHFDGHSDGNNAYPKFAHLGGMQMIGDLLVVPLQNPLPGEGASSAVSILDVQNPELPVLIHTQALPPNKAHAAAIVRLDDERYLLAILTHPDSTQIDLYLTEGPDLRNTAFTFWRSYNAADVSVPGAVNGFWPSGGNSYQMINFVRDTNGDIFLIGTRNDGFPAIFGNDWMDLFEVQLDVVQHQFSLVYRDQIHQYLNFDSTGRIGNCFAAAGVHVTPTGQLIIYCAEHENGGPNETVRMGEIRSREVHTDLAMQPCGGWVELYEDNDGWSHNEGKGRSIMFDFADRNLESLNDFNQLEGFGDKASSVIYFLKPGQRVTLYEHDHSNSNNSGRSLVLEGTGQVEYITNLEDPGFEGLGDDISSLKFERDQLDVLVAPATSVPTVATGLSLLSLWCSGTTLRVEPASYPETLVIDQPVTILNATPAGGVVIIGQ